ncbi:MAG: Holliday junction branch migration protein RuvA [Anaerolineales bacterium]|nr:Holliday junction branch migration protein RuvA [Anaerolineales bacterium]
MIASINGKIIDIDKGSLTISLGGVGVQVHVSEAVIMQYQIGQVIFLQTNLIVREDSLTLYGFPTKEEKQYFDLLLGVSGIGPRLSLAILSALTPDAIRRGVFSEQVEVFSGVPGVGKKTAQKILIHLQDKLEDIDLLGPLTRLDNTGTEVFEALTTLGYSVVEAQAAVQSIPRDAPDDLEERIRIALAYFSH